MRQEQLGLSLLILLTVSIGAVTAASQLSQNSASLPAPVVLTAEQDHQRLMDLLHVASSRRGPSGDPKAPDAANVDESKYLCTRCPIR